MRKLVAAAFAVVFAAASMSSMAQSKSVWEIDPAHANAQFTVRHLGISNVQGEFTKVTGSAELDEQDVTKSKVNATIDVNSIDTRNSDRDADLKSDHFFDAAKFPTMTFQSRKIAQTADGKLKMTGDLTIHGVTHEVTFDVDGPSSPIQVWNGLRRGAAATIKLNRQDFGLTYNGKLGSGEAMIGNDIAITLDIEFVKKS